MSLVFDGSRLIRVNEGEAGQEAIRAREIDSATLRDPAIIAAVESARTGITAQLKAFQTEAIAPVITVTGKDVRPPVAPIQQTVLPKGNREFETVRRTAEADARSVLISDSVTPSKYAGRTLAVGSSSPEAASQQQSRHLAGVTGPVMVAVIFVVVIVVMQTLRR